MVPVWGGHPRIVLWLSAPSELAGADLCAVLTAHPAKSFWLIILFSQSRWGQGLSLSIIWQRRDTEHPGRTLRVLLELARKQQGMFEICEYLWLCKPRINK